jgi:hypothetical protein
MANYKYEVIIDNEISVKFDTKGRAEEYKLAIEKTNNYNTVSIKRYWYMDELITQEDSNESK